MRRIQPILRRNGNLERKEISDTSCDGPQICTQNFAHTVSECENIFCGARDTELLKCQEHRTFVVPGAQADHSAIVAVLGPHRSDKSFIFAMTLPSIRVRAL